MLRDTLYCQKKKGCQVSHPSGHVFMFTVPSRCVCVGWQRSLGALPPAGAEWGEPGATHDVESEGERETSLGYNPAITCGGRPWEHRAGLRSSCKALYGAASKPVQVIRDRSQCGHSGMSVWHILCIICITKSTSFMLCKLIVNSFQWQN